MSSYAYGYTKLMCHFSLNWYEVIVVAFEIASVITRIKDQTCTPNDFLHGLLSLLISFKLELIVYYLASVFWHTGESSVCFTHLNLTSSEVSNVRNAMLRSAHAVLHVWDEKFCFGRTFPYLLAYLWASFSKFMRWLSGHARLARSYFFSYR